MGSAGAGAGVLLGAGADTAGLDGATVGWLLLLATSDGEGCGAAGSGVVCCAVCCGAVTPCWAGAWVEGWLESAAIRVAWALDASADCELVLGVLVSAVLSVSFLAMR